MADVIGNTSKYSVWLSNAEYSSSGNTFMYLCSNPSFGYSVSYNGTTTGILGQDPSKAIFVDPSTGAVGNITISGVRASPGASAPDMSSNNTTHLTNADFYRKVRQMMTNTQFMQKAYILRMYGVDTKNPTQYRELYVYLKDILCSFNTEEPADMTVTIQAIRRNRDKGFGTS